MRRHAYIISAAQIGSKEAKSLVLNAWPLDVDKKDSEGNSRLLQRFREKKAKALASKAEVE